jgi:glycogen debranching enzyme
MAKRRNQLLKTHLEPELMEHNGMDQFSVLASTSLQEERTFKLKYGDCFAILNKYGDILPFRKSVQGIYYEGTRFLSDFQVRIDGQKPLYLSSDTKEGNEMISVDLTNPDILLNGELKLAKGSVHIMRKKILWEGVYYEQMRIYNYSLEHIDFRLDLHFNADYDDIFEVRGTTRAKKGKLLPPKATANRLKLSYLGLDSKQRTTRIFICPDPESFKKNMATFDISLGPNKSHLVAVTATFMITGEDEKDILGFPLAIKKYKRRIEYINRTSCDVITSNTQFNHWIHRSKADMITMITDTQYGPYPYAGIPWYNTPFGRDGIITALECLWISPEVAKGALEYLAATQAKEIDSFRDAEPGKILHESRHGEMADLNEIPFKQYYGSIDSTPLFIVLAGAYFKRTGDVETISRIWPNIELALTWIDIYGDKDGDMFVEYERKEKSGLFNQGWKDSHDAVSYSDGRIINPPIALCEVQGYVYDAWNKASLMAKTLGLFDKARTLAQRAESLKEKFSKHFWSEDKSTFYLALDADKKPCNVVSSNAGHCLFSGIATKEQAMKVALSLFSTKMFTGWGIRTLASGEVRFNPMSYHNGSVWPHDNALIAYGLAKYGLKSEVTKVTKALFDASLFIEGQRLPELFCGFKRREGEPPTDYPVACSPQTWSVASCFMIIQSFLGMELDAFENVIRFHKPVLPDFIESLEIRNLKFRKNYIDIRFTKAYDSVSISILNKDSSVRMEIT